jgi:hypothetical protein
MTAVFPFSAVEPARLARMALDLVTTEAEGAAERLAAEYPAA